MKDLLKQLTALSGPSGFEHDVSSFIHNYLISKTDEVRIDRIGNVISRMKGNQKGPVTLLTAHMDEVGFIVKKIEPNGLLRFEKIGGNDDRQLLAQPVTVMGKNGYLDGIIGTMSAHFSKFDNKDMVRKHSSLYIDIGANSSKEVFDLGVEIGTPITWKANFLLFGPEHAKKIRSKALDDRAGCAVLLSLVDSLQSRNFSGEIIFLFSVQEEVGLRGAKVAAEHLDADVAIAIDTTAASDTGENINLIDETIKLGAGTGIKIMDASLIVHKSVKDRLVKLALTHSISYQPEIFMGIGTDGGATNYANKGIPTGVLSIPSRYTHSSVEVIDLKDLERTKELVTQFIISLDGSTSFSYI